MTEVWCHQPPIEQVTIGHIDACSFLAYRPEVNLPERKT